jgi:polyhydroxybutyrate depolymerase
MTCGRVAAIGQGRRRQNLFNFAIRLANAMQTGEIRSEQRKARLKVSTSNRSAAALRLPVRFLVLALAALACALVFTPAPASAAARLTIESGGISRSAVVVLRDRLKLRRRPLVIVLHRGGGLGARIRRHLGLEEVAESSKPIFVYPDAINGVWPAGPGADADRDIKFLRDLTERFIREGVVDPRRIFVVGVSSGGVFAYRAVCAGIGRPVAGLATLISAMPADLANCAPGPVAYVAVSNASDPRIPYAGGKATLTEANFDALPAESALALFARNNGCGARRDDRAFPEHESRGAAKFVRGAILSYAGCKASAELIRVDRGGHRIPGRKPDRQPALEPAADEEDFDAARAIWDFLKRNGA